MTTTVKRSTSRSRTKIEGKKRVIEKQSKLSVGSVLGAITFEVFTLFNAGNTDIITSESDN